MIKLVDKRKIVKLKNETRTGQVATPRSENNPQNKR